MTTLIKYLCWFVAAYFFVGAGLYFGQDYLFFHPQKLPKNYAFVFKQKFIEFNILAQDSVAINCLFFESKTAQPKGIVVYYHGNADNMQRWGQHAKDFTKNGYNVLMYDYRSFGKTNGKIEEKQWLADGFKVFEWAKNRYELNKIVVYGRSLGTALASQIATQYAVKQLILETPYTKICNVAKSYLPIYPTGLLCKYYFNNTQNMAHLKCKYHIFHGTADAVVPFAQAKELCFLTGDSTLKNLTIIPKGGHKNLATFGQYQNSLDSLLRL